jgi:hypothetical protein
MFSRVFRHFKPIATADGRDFQMERSMPRMAAIVQKRLGRFPFGAYLKQAGRSRMNFAEMGT